MKGGNPGSPDFIIFFSVLGLLTVGIIMVYSASAVSANVNFADSCYFLKRQLILATLGIFALLLMMKTDYHIWQKLSKPIMLGTFILLILVLIFGLEKVVNGARRWLGFGAVYLQSLEIAKLSMVLFYARNLASRQERLKLFIKGLVPQLLIFGLILKEPDLGLALSIAGTLFILLFTSGAKLSHLSSISMAGAAGIILAAIIMEPYRVKAVCSV